MRKSKTFHSDNSGFVHAMDFVQQFLADCRIGKKAQLRATLVMEEMLGSLMDHRKGDEIYVSAHSLFGSVTIELSAAGDPFSLTENRNLL